jgi:hypothetical protein
MNDRIKTISRFTGPVNESAPAEVQYNGTAGEIRNEVFG